MDTFVARAVNGRLVLDEPVPFPEGTILELCIVGDVDVAAEQIETTALIERLRPTAPNANSTATAPTLSHFDLWVGNNNPDLKLEYGKGFWDYVEMLERLIAKFDAVNARVVGTYIVRTPPPEEELRMPAVAFEVRGVTFAVRHDFAPQEWPYEWTVSVVRRSPYLGPIFGLFEPELDLSKDARTTGLPTELILGAFRRSPSAFTCRLIDEWDVATLIRLTSYED
jgi:hypothetical protein